MLSHSAAEILAEEEALVAPFLCTETRVVLNKNGTAKVSSTVDISATERLSITKYCYFRDHINTFKMSPITWNSINDHRRSRPSIFCLEGKSFLCCTINVCRYCKPIVAKSVAQLFLNKGHSTAKVTLLRQGKWLSRTLFLTHSPSNQSDQRVRRGFEYAAFSRRRGRGWR